MHSQGVTGSAVLLARDHGRASFVRWQWWRYVGDAGTASRYEKSNNDAWSRHGRQHNEQYYRHDVAFRLSRGPRSFGHRMDTRYRHHCERGPLESEYGRVHDATRSFEYCAPC